jgi:tRNA nucleotidyltransferase (CCA-adding enzyme)
MKTYLVGGAVRDRLLGLPVGERDWVVVGSTPEEMLQQGFRPVGRDFPVFLHPKTKEEYALARTERKTGPGYTGFETRTDPGITLEDDLLRRDLTINAMAESADGELIDPFNGREDLDKGILRHVSPAFVEDPVRILRTARFAARFAQFGFHVAHGTNTLMRQMVRQGEVDHLVPERVWAEVEKALGEKSPARFFAVLHGCGALARLFPEMAPLARGHDKGAHPERTIALPVLENTVALGGSLEMRFAALICDIDNGLPQEPGTGALDRLCDRYRVPNACRALAGMALRYRHTIHAAATLCAAELLELLTALDAFRRSRRLQDLLVVCEADARAANPALTHYDAADRLRLARTAAATVAADTRSGKPGKEIGALLRQQRVSAIHKAITA